MCERKAKFCFLRTFETSLISALLGIILFSNGAVASEHDYRLAFSTYFGGSGYEEIRDVFADDTGNVYVTGGTNSPDFPTTPGAFDRTFDNTGTHIGTEGHVDAFVAKFDANGKLLFSTLLGGPNYDRAYAIEVDSQGYVYVAGRAGPGFPVTSGAFQTEFKGSGKGAYGLQNGFIAKFSPEGSSLVWASYVGISKLCRDLALDDNGDVYVPFGVPLDEGKSLVKMLLRAFSISSKKQFRLPTEWFANAFQKVPQGSEDCGVMKVKGDGSEVLWATYLGGSGMDTQTASIRVNDTGHVFIALSTDSSDIPTTAGAHDRIHNGQVDYYVAKLKPDGSDLVWGTYLGGSGEEWISTHNLALDPQGNVIVTVWTSSADFPTTPNAFFRTYGGGRSDIAVSKLSASSGALLGSTYIGGKSLENPDGTGVDASGHVYISGQTHSKNFPVTPNAYQSIYNGGNGDAFLLLLSAEFDRLLYCTYMGGKEYDDGRSGFLDQKGNIYLAGSTTSRNWPVKNAHKNYYSGKALSGDGIIAKFVPDQ